MSLFDLQLGKKIGTTKNDIVKQKMNQKLNEMMDIKVAENAMLAEDLFERRSNAIGKMAESSGISRTFLGKKNLIQKKQFEKRLKEQLFIESVNDIFVEALVLDDNFKNNYLESFFNFTESTINHLIETGKMSYDWILEEGSISIKNILKFCEETAEKVSDELFKPDEISKEKQILNEKNKKDKKDVKDEIKSDFDDKTANDKANIAEVVRDKVVNTIRNEQEKAEKEKELNDTILSQTEDETTDTVNESMRMIRIPNKLRKESLFKSIQLNIANKALNESAAQSNEEFKLDMDMVLAESIVHYTLLETLYTAGIIDIKPSELRTFSKELIIKS